MNSDRTFIIAYLVVLPILTLLMYLSNSFNIAVFLGGTASSIYLTMWGN